MLNLTGDFKEKVVAALLNVRQNYEGSDSAFAKKWGINPSVFNRIKNGEREGLLKESQWLNMGRDLSVSLNDRKWNVARTAVFNQIEEEVTFCKRYAKSMIFVDDCEIGKTFTCQYLSKTLKNCFYVDASQSKTKQLFVRNIAKCIGLDDTGRYATVKANIKYYLKTLQEPIVIIDEPGDLDYNAFLEIKELWNGTEGACAWYLIGADGLAEKMEKGINHRKVGYREIFSRFSGKYSSIVPPDRKEKMVFYRQLISDVLSVNMDDKSGMEPIIRRCLSNEGGSISGLRRAESLLILNNRSNG